MGIKTSGSRGGSRRKENVERKLWERIIIPSLCVFFLRILTFYQNFSFWRKKLKLFIIHLFSH